MKKKVCLIFLLLSILLILPLSLGANLIYHGPNIQVTLLSQSPDPVEPGQILTVKFKIENTGEEATIDTIVKLLPKFPFSLYGDQAEKNLGKLRAGQTGADAAIVEYKLKVEETAVEGDAEIELMVRSTQDAWVSYTDNELLIAIQTHDAVLDIAKITQEPETISPGGTAKVNFLIKNLADSLLKDIQFRLEFSSSTLPLAPYQSSSERRIAQLQSNFQQSLSFQLIADPAASSGLYKIPLNITYNDEKGKHYMVKDILAVLIGEKPYLKTSIKKTSVLQANQPGKLTLEIANAGPTDVKFVELTLLPSPDYQLVSPSLYFYLGDIDSDDTESEEIDVFVNKKVKTLAVPIQLKYADANNQPYQQNLELNLALYSSSQLKKFGIIEKDKLWLYGLVLLLLGLGYFFYRHSRKKI